MKHACYCPLRPANLKADETSTRLQHAPHLPKRSLDVHDIPHGKACSHAVERIIDKGQRKCISTHKVHWQTAPNTVNLPLEHHRHREIYTYRTRTLACKVVGNSSRAGRHIECYITRLRRGLAHGICPPMPILPETHQDIHQVVPA